MRSIIIKPGDKFHEWTVVKEIEVEPSSQRKVLCVNNYGVERIVRLGHLRSGASKGNLSKGKSNGNYSHGMRKTRIWRIWRNMKNRCLNKNFPEYKNYGARGITICNEWLLFEGFYKDMYKGYGEKLSIERIDNNGNYCKDNCVWATNKQQALNKRDTLYVELNGEKVKLFELAEKVGIKYTTLYQRVYRYKIPIEDAIKKNIGRRR